MNSEPPAQHLNPTGTMPSNAEAHTPLATGQRSPQVYVNADGFFRWFAPAMLMGVGGMFGWAAVKSALADEPSLSMLIIAFGFTFIFLISGALAAIHVRKGCTRRITIDYNARTIRFENFRLLSTFFSGFRAIPEQFISFDDLLGVGRMRNPRGSDQLHIAVRGGRITVNEHFNDFYALERALQSIAGESAPAPFRHTVAYQWVLALGAIPVAALVLYIIYLAGVLDYVFDTLR